MVTIISDFNLNVQLIFSNFIFDFPKLITEKKEGAKTAPRAQLELYISYTWVINVSYQNLQINN